MAARKTSPKRKTPASKASASKVPARRAAPRALTAAELPVTRAMLGEVRTELLHRIDQAKAELRGEIQAVKTELRAEIQAIKADQYAIRADQHAIRADIARIALIVEEQDARNKIVLDALSTFIDRQNRLERRMDQVEETVRALAATTQPR